MNAAAKRPRHRTAAVYTCERCGALHHPCRASARRFCSPECSRAEQQETSRRLRAEAKARAWARPEPGAPPDPIALVIQSEMKAALAELEAFLAGREAGS